MSDQDYAVYTIYGTHDIFGPDALLYVGKADVHPLPEPHERTRKNLRRYESPEVTVHLGRVGNTRPITDKRWGELINIAEVLTIDYLTPAYNERGKRRMRILEPVLLLNYGRRHRLRLCLTNLPDLIEDLSALKLCGGATHRPLPPVLVDR
jgi:hypothetical protein